MKRVRVAVVATVVVGAMLGWLAWSPPSAAEANAAASAASATVPVAGGSWNLQGVNMPWYNWGCDFGCGANGGASSTAAQTGPRFAQMKQNNLHNVRWWMFEGDAWQITRDATGRPTGINPAVYTDIDAALRQAQQYDLYFTFVLFSFPGDIPQSWLNDPVQRQQLANVLAPLFARYSGNVRVLSWDLFNEPEWDMWNGKVNSANVQATVRSIVAAVHANSSTMVTIGSAMLDGLSFWTGMGLDYYQAHWYDYMQPGNWCAYCRDYSEVKAQYGLDKPLVIGEFFSGAGQVAIDRWENFFAKGYAGAWAWSLFPEKTSDKMAVDLAAAGTFASRHLNVVGPRVAGGSELSPPPTATATSIPGRSTSPVPTTATTVATVPPPTATPTKPATSTPTTVPPTATPTRAPAQATPTATATQPPPTNIPAQWLTTASTSVATLAAGQRVAAQAFVTAPKSGTYLIDVEIYGPSGEKMYQKWFDKTNLAAGQRQGFSVPWTIPAGAPKGTWTVKIGVFSPGWSSLIAWDNDTGGTFTVR
ncbi:MAG: hypothetical protein HYX53_05205 [Chloroflexi bacterium]|nr:hypothetical protein [Chloroflexota bacterium]